MSEDYLKAVELGLRSRAPEMLKEIVSAQERHLISQGKAADLARFRETRAVCDEYWQEHGDLLRYKFETAQKQAALDEVKREFVQREERERLAMEVDAHRPEDRELFPEELQEEEASHNQLYEEVQRTLAAQEAAEKDAQEYSTESREMAQHVATRDVLSESEIWLRLNTPETLKRNVAEYTRQLALEPEKLEKWLASRAEIDAAWRERGEAIRVERSTFVFNPGQQRDDRDFVAARRIQDAHRDPERLRALVTENQILHEKERRAALEGALRVTPRHKEESRPLGPEEASEDVVARVAARTATLQPEQKHDITAVNVPKVRR